MSNLWINAQYRIYQYFLLDKIIFEGIICTHVTQLLILKHLLKLLIRAYNFKPQKEVEEDYYLKKLIVKIVKRLEFIFPFP